MSRPSSSPVRRGVLALVLAAVLGTGTALAGPGLAVASPPAPPTPHKPLAMGTFAARDYAAAAAQLPAGLAHAVARDVHLTGAQYLADAAAAIRAPKVVASLKAAGVHVLGSRIDGTKLTVNVASKSDVAAVESTGSTAVVGAPKLRDFSKSVFHKVTTTNTYGGEGYFYQERGQTNGNGFRCSIGFNGYSVSTGAQQFATAGHCATTIPSNHSAFLLSESTPFDAPGGPNPNPVVTVPLGTTVPREAQYGSGRDYGIISSGDAGIVTHNSVATWGTSGSTSSSNVSTGLPTATSPWDIAGQTAATVGATLCKSGSSSGWTCGTIDAVDFSIPVSGKVVNTIVATTCLLPGDSGGGAVIGHDAVGIDSGSTFPESVSEDPSYPCGNPDSDPSQQINDPGFVSVFFPMVSASSDATVRANSVLGQQGTHWQLGVAVSSTATVTSPASGATVYSFTSMSGTVSGATASSTALLYLDGKSTPFRKVSASSGTWTMPLTGMPVGTHSYSLSAGLGWSPGPAVTGTITIAAADRIGGADRFAVAVAEAQQEFPEPGSGPIPALFIANGLNYPDGLGAAPAAAHLNGTLLLTAPTFLPSDVAAEVNALQPATIYVAGGTGSVSASVFNQLVTMVSSWGGSVIRDGGATRYQSSQTVAQSAFPAGVHVDKIFIANGGNFPDALSESGAAAKEGAPVILVPGTAQLLDSATIALFEGYTPTEIVIAGGTASVSTGIQNQLAALNVVPAPTVLRLGGADRYQVSHLINTTFFSTSANAYFANGGNFPDALGGGVLAASSNAPLTVTPSTCMEPYDITALANWGVTHVTLIGGLASQSAAVASFTPCK